MSKCRQYAPHLRVRPAPCQARRRTRLSLLIILWSLLSSGCLPEFRLIIDYKGTVHHCADFQWPFDVQGKLSLDNRIWIFWSIQPVEKWRCRSISTWLGYEWCSEPNECELFPPSSEWLCSWQNAGMLTFYIHAKPQSHPSSCTKYNCCARSGLNGKD